jgi:hypothetical protein
VPVLRDAAARHRSELPYRYFFEPPYPTPSVRALVTDRHKLVVVEGSPPMLFDLRADPHERHDLLSGPRDAEVAALVATLSRRLDALEQPTADPDAAGFRPSPRAGTE